MINSLISLAAVAVRCDKVRTSAATTAKPRPARPRGASTAAFSARMLVWKAMESITPMMLLMRLLLSWMPFMVFTTLLTTAPPCSATRVASWRAGRHGGAFGVLAHGGAHFVHRRGRLLQRCGLLLGAGGQIVVARRDFTARGRHAFCTLANGAHHFGEALAHVAQARHDADFVPARVSTSTPRSPLATASATRLRSGGLPQVAHHRAQVQPRAERQATTSTITATAMLRSAAARLFTSLMVRDRRWLWRFFHYPAR